MKNYKTHLNLLKKNYEKIKAKLLAAEKEVQDFENLKNLEQEIKVHRLSCWWPLDTKDDFSGKVLTREDCKIKGNGKIFISKEIRKMTDFVIFVKKDYKSPDVSEFYIFPFYVVSGQKIYAEQFLNFKNRNNDWSFGRDAHFKNYSNTIYPTPTMSATDAVAEVLKEKDLPVFLQKEILNICMLTKQNNPQFPDLSYYLRA